MTDIGTFLRRQSIEKWTGEIPTFENHIVSAWMDILLGIRKE